MAKTKKKGKMRQKKRSKTRETVALTLALIAIAFLLINSIYAIVAKEKIINEILQNESLKDIQDVVPLINSILLVFMIAWLVLAAIISVVVYLIEKGKAKWYWLLILSIISLLIARIDVAIIGTIASILYKK